MEAKPAFIFDLDGVLVDTARFHFLAWKKLAGELDIPFTEKDNEQLKGVSRRQSLDIILELGHRQLPEPEKEKLAERKNTWYLAYINRLTPADILPGALPFVQVARSMGLRLAVGSASKNAGVILQKLSLSSYFDAVITGHDTTRTKPDPEVFLLAARALAVAPHTCVVFEDAAAGIEAAHRAGMAAVGIGSREVLQRADLIASGLDKLQVEDVLAFYGNYVTNRKHFSK